MDRRTLDTYDARAAHYVDDWLSQPAPIEVYKIAETYFQRGGATSNVGSGSGRDTNWLNNNGFPCVGFDASQGLLDQARARFPNLTFREASLPNLAEIPSASFDNVLCETVLMHLPHETHLESLKNLLRILKPGGTLSLSWRLPINAEQAREKDGRLYELVDSEALKAEAERWGATCLHQDTFVSPSSGKRIEQVIFRT